MTDSGSARLPNPAQLAEALDSILKRARAQPRKAESRSLIGLFAGPFGTGKTLAARALARGLDSELQRVYLSQVIGRYIGETEKNLDRVLAANQSSGVVLFFDEADALFGKRTAVEDAHDKHAEEGAGYLLRRLEAHGGLVIFGSRSRQDLDEAFIRRIEFVVDFPFPDPPRAHHR